MTLDAALASLGPPSVLRVEPGRTFQRRPGRDDLCPLRRVSLEPLSSPAWPPGSPQPAGVEYLQPPLRTRCSRYITRLRSGP
jgi:hypothetical protein